MRRCDAITDTFDFARVDSRAEAAARVARLRFQSFDQCQHISALAELRARDLKINNDASSSDALDA